MSPPIRYQVCAQDGTLQAVHLHTTRPRSKKKDMPWELPNGTKGLGGRSVKTLPLYRSETLRALKPGAMILVCEGEKATDAAVALEFDAVGTVTGSSAIPERRGAPLGGSVRGRRLAGCRPGGAQAHGPHPRGALSVARGRTSGSRWWTRHGWG